MSAGDVETARQKHEGTRAELERVSGRDQILVDELRKAQDELRAAHDALHDGVEPWREDVVTAARKVAADGLALILTAARAMQVVKPWHAVPNYTMDLPAWLDRAEVHMPSKGPEPAVCDAVSSALHQLGRSQHSKDEEITVPRPPAPALAERTIRVERPTGLSRNTTRSGVPSWRNSLLQSVRSSRISPKASFCPAPMRQSLTPPRKCLPA